MIKPERLKAGDKVAYISLSSSTEENERFKWNYEMIKEQLWKAFEVELIYMENALESDEKLYNEPSIRAKDLTDAFEDPEIKGIMTNIGIRDSIRIVPYVNTDAIVMNPKIFLGYADSTIIHLLCHQLGLVSFYGPSVDYEYVKEYEKGNVGDIVYIDRALFTPEDTGKLEDRDSYTLLQGKGVVTGHLIGGSMESLEVAKGTDIWPEIDSFRNSILVLELPKRKLEGKVLRRWLRNYGAQGILQVVKGIFFESNGHEEEFEVYKDSILQVMKEFKLEDTPVLYNEEYLLSVNKPIMPFGVLAELNCEEKTFVLLEPGVI